MKVQPALKIKAWLLLGWVFLYLFCIPSRAADLLALPPQENPLKLQTNLQTELHALPSKLDHVSFIERNSQPLYLLAQASDGSKRGPVSADAITVIFPDIGEPFRSIFAKIIEGIEEQVRGKVRSMPISNQEAPEINSQLRRNGTRVVIALGQRGYKIASGLDRDFSVVIGGVLSIPDGDHSQFSVISLTPDPNLLFAQLKNLIPGIKRVLVVYNPGNNEWLIKLARIAAKNQSLELVTYEARDLASAAHQYETAFAASDSRFDSLWLPQDSTTVEESTIMPLVLKESWNRGVPIFSSNFLHVKKGALFALYPNNLEMGRNLAASAVNLANGDNSKRGLSPLKDVLSALNIRTASRIGINIGAQRQRSFDFIFPEP